MAGSHQIYPQPTFFTAATPAATAPAVAAPAAEAAEIPPEVAGASVVEAEEIPPEVPGAAVAEPPAAQAAGAAVVEAA